MSCLRYRLFLPSKTSILQVISNEKKHSFKLLSLLERERKVHDRTCRLSIQTTAGKNTLQVFFILFTRPPSPSGICGTLPLPLVLLTTTAKKKTLFAGIHVSSRGIAGFTEQRENAHEKFLLHEAYISKTDPVILLF